MPDNLNPSPLGTESPPAQPVLTFGQAIEIVLKAPDLTEGVKGNIVSALARVASLVAPVARTSAIVDVGAIAKTLERITPARLGYKHKGSLAALKSNFWRGLGIVGYTVLPGRHVTKLAPAWADLLGLLEEKSARCISRLAHVASDQGWFPGDITDEHIERFRQLVATTCGPSKTKKVVRNSIRTWNQAAASVEGWPNLPLSTGRKGDWYYARPWSCFPSSFRADVDAFLDRGEKSGNFLTVDASLPLRPRTKRNYQEGFRRAASILTLHDVLPDSIVSISALVEPERARSILMFLHERAGRKDGGHIGFMAMLLYIAARDWVYPDAKEGSVGAHIVAKLEVFFRNTKQKKKGMSDRTRERLSQFDDPVILRNYLALPQGLMAKAKKLPVSEDAARLARLALFISISIDTLLRVEDVVSLNLKEHLYADGDGRRRRLFVRIPEAEIKNGVTFHGVLRPQTVRILDAYLGNYRQFHGEAMSPFLFPGAPGSHWREDRVRDTLKDYCLRELGIDMTPHVHRALGGKIILQDYPGALADVQQSLGHMRMSTSATYYIDQNKSAVDARYHAILERRRKGIGPEYV